MQPRKEDKKWQLKAASVNEWEQWIDEQKKAAGAKGDDVYVQASIDTAGVPSMCMAD